MLRRSLILTIAVLFAWTMIVFAKDAPSPKSTQKVFAEKGHIYYFPDGKKKIQLTKTGKNRAPVLSPDGKRVVFLRKSDKEAYLAVGGSEDYVKDDPDGLLADQVWIVDVTGKNEKMLATDHNPDEIAIVGDFNGSEVIAHIDDDTLQFSPDSNKVYFITAAWVTSGALHSVNIDGSGERFIAGANYLKVIDKGGCKGCLIINQHRYFVTGGSYDWYYVFTPDGKEVGPLGNDLESVDWDFLYSDFIKSK